MNEAMAAGNSTNAAEGLQSDAAALQGSHDTTAPAQLTAAFIPAAPAAGASTQPGVLSEFWQQQMQEVSQVSSDPAEFKNHQLPLARIKKIMKSDEDVRMISAEAPVLFAKACEMFILELTARAWSHSEENKRRTLQRNDISAAVRRTDVFDFLVDIIPQDERDDAAPKPQAPPAQASISQPAQVLAHHPSVPAGLDPQALQYWPGRGSYQPQQQQQPQAQPQQVAPQLQSVQGQAARPAQPQWQVQHHSSVLHGMQQGQVQPAQTASTAAGMPRLQPMHRPTLQPPQPQVQQQQQQYQHQQQQQSAPRLMQNVAMMQPAQTQGAKP